MVQQECWCPHIYAFAPCVHEKPIKTPRKCHQLTHQGIAVNTPKMLCSQSATRQKKPKSSTVKGKILKNMVPYPPPPNPYISEKPFSVAFGKGITCPYQRNTIFPEIG